MKIIKLLWMVTGVCTSLSLASCSSDELTEMPADGDATITFNCQAPASPTSATRAYSDGQTAKNLYYAVYTTNADGTHRLTETNLPNTEVSANKPYTFSNETRPSTQVTLHVAVGQTYTVLFFGAATDAPYSFDPTDGSLDVTYTGAGCNDESRDAFYKAFTFTATKTAETRTVVLTRPFAQVNVGTALTDWQNAAKHNFTPSQTQFVVNGAYTKLDMFTGAVSDTVTATFSLADLPGDSEVFPKLNADGTSDYKYLSMNYVLVGESSQNFPCTFTANTFPAGENWYIQSVPMQRNHRTNIYGSGMLTFTATVNVEIDPIYDTPDYNFDPYQQLIAVAAKGEGTVDLSGDILIDHSITCKGSGDQVITINLNGHTVRVSADDYDLDPFIINGGTVIINGPGLVDSSDGQDHTAVRVNAGTLIVNGGTYINGYYSDDYHQSLFDQYGKYAYIIINDGVFMSPYNVNDCGWIFAHIVGYNNIKVYGGEFYKYDPSMGVDHLHSADGVRTTAIGNFVADGYESVPIERDGITWYKVQKIAE